jgi:hypothetical protein
MVSSDQEAKRHATIGADLSPESTFDDPGYPTGDMGGDGGGV